MRLLWDDHYPDPAVLRREVRCMVGAWVGVLLDAIPEGEITGIYWKGSSQKHWDSPVDYVPELSDVDLHVLFTEDAAAERHLGSLEQALRIQSRVESEYRSKVPRPLHVPRPQLMVLNRLLQQEDYVATPQAAVSVLHGKEHVPRPDHSDPVRARRIARDHLLKETDHLSSLPLHLVDKPGKFLWQGVRPMTWHVAPLGAKVLVLLGVSPEEAWTLNRTTIVARLEAAGEERLARDYAGFYLSGWEYFLSGWSDTEAGRSTIAAGVRALERGVRIAQSRPA